MKQGKTEKAVFAKLSTEKVELEQHNVELGLMQDFDKMQSEAEQLWKSAENKVGNILRTAMDKVDSELNPMNQIRAKLSNMIREFDTKADELGLDNSVKNGYIKSGLGTIDALD
jgi:hypothetical protein